MTKEDEMKVTKEQQRVRVGQAGPSRPVTLIWDNFSPHTDQSIVDLCASHNIQCFPLSPRCTSKYQPLDVNFNGPKKRALTEHFGKWHINTLLALRQAGKPIRDVLPRTAAMKREFIAKLVVGVHALFLNRRQTILEAWKKSNLQFSKEEFNSTHTENDISVDLGLVSTLEQLLTHWMKLLVKRILMVHHFSI
jgi:hypothetical protein